MSHLSSNVASALRWRRPATFDLARSSTLAALYQGLVAARTIRQNVRCIGSGNLAKFDPHPNEDQQFKLPKSLESGSACRRDFAMSFCHPSKSTIPYRRVLQALRASLLGVRLQEPQVARQTPKRMKRPDDTGWIRFKLADHHRPGSDSMCR